MTEAQRELIKNWKEWNPEYTTSEEGYKGSLTIKSFIEIIDSLEDQLKQADEMVLDLYSSKDTGIAARFIIKNYLLERGLIKSEVSGE